MRSHHCRPVMAHEPRSDLDRTGANTAEGNGHARLERDPGLFAVCVHGNGEPPQGVMTAKLQAGVDRVTGGARVTCRRDAHVEPAQSVKGWQPLPCLVAPLNRGTLSGGAAGAFGGVGLLADCAADVRDRELGV